MRSNILGPRSRNRLWYLTAVIAVIAAGLASRRFPGPLPAFLGKYPGDALWSLMVFFGWGYIHPPSSTVRIAALALGTSFAVEFLKLIQLPWLVSIRHTTAGHLVLGHGFSWQNLVAYTAGIALGVMVEVVFLQDKQTR